MSQIAAIETRYAGCRFRSRLEARWAVFFDTLGITWEYEPQGFELPDGDGPPVRYLPDFKLTSTDGDVLWAEVKGSESQLRDDIERIEWFLDFNSPLDGMHDSWATRNGFVLLGPIPRPRPGRYWIAPGVQHSGGLFRSWCAFGRGTWSVHSTQEPWPSWDPTCNPLDGYEADVALLAATGIVEALTAARSARFEHGEIG